ncbi:MAG: hypothetical protein JWP91_441 [Fibrobacteres bacterium]|nr:hypothetical protein [Fibrobacterota bacterium]
MPALNSVFPSVFAYSDYRQYLKDYHEAASAKDRKFSHRFISDKVGASSTGWFSDLIKGRINLAGTQLVRLAELLKLKENETDYFEILVQYNQAGSLEEKNRHLRKMLTFKEMRVDLVGEGKFEFYSHWYYAAVRELLFFHPFRDDYVALAKKMDPPIKPAQAKEAIRLLEKLDFIRKDAQGLYRPREMTLKKDPSLKSILALNLLRINMELGMQALDKFQKDERHVSAMTLSYSAPGFEKAVAEIDALRRKLVALMEDDADPAKVFQFNIQFFPVTR